MSEPFACRACGARRSELIVSLGYMPLANAFRTAADLTQPEERYPLELVLCPACSVVQITETVPPEKLFREYLYFSSLSDTMLRHAETLVAYLIDERRLTRSSFVVEIASNDGYLLQYYARRGIPVLGIEPAANVANVAEDRGVPTVCEFFGEALAERLVGEGRRADVLHAHNVLAHVPQPASVLRGIATLLAAEGIAVIEVPYLKDLIDRCEFDTIYHEHLSYFSLTALHRLCGVAGLTLVDVRRIPLHGGSLQIIASRAESRAETSGRVRQLLEEERSWGVDRLEGYDGFRRRVPLLKRSLVDLVARLRSEGRRVAAYGAAAKGTVLLNYCRFGPTDVEFVVDRSPHKQGLFMPGTHNPILPPSTLLEARPDFTLLLAWNLAEEILAQQEEYRRRGGRFIIPIPEVQIV